MVTTTLQLTAGAYLLASVLAAMGFALESARWARVGVAALIVAVLLHGYSFSILHRADPTPPLTDLAMALSFTAWVSAAALLLFLRRFRLSRLVVWVGSLAFLAVFNAALRLPGLVPAPIAEPAGSLPHAHVLLASAGLALLALAGMAGGLFLIEHRRLKRKAVVASSGLRPSLEALDRVNALALAVGFPLLTLGVVTGAMWVQSRTGSPWAGSPHEIGSFIYWLLYGVLLVLRFGADQGARRCATNAIGGLAVATCAVIGLELFA